MTSASRASHLVCFLLGALIALPATAQDETSEPANVTEARGRLTRGEALYERGDYEGALVEFEEAHRLIGPHPARHLVLYNIGQCYERLFRYDDASRYYARYLEAAPADEPDRAAVEATVRTLEGMLGTVGVTTNVPAALWVDGHEVGRAPAQVRIPAGRHLVEVRAPGYVDARDEVDVTGRGSTTLTLTLEEETAPYEGLDPSAFTITSVAAGLVGIGALTLGIMALSERGRVDGALADPAQRWTITEDDQSWIRSLALTTDLLLGSAGVLAITATVLAFLTNWSDDSEAEERVRFVPGLASAAIVGRFE